MKNRFYIAFIVFLIVLGAVACSKKENISPAPSSMPLNQADVSPSPSEISPMSAYKAVMQNKAAFFSVDANKELYISQLNQTVSGDTSINAKAVKFAIADLEKDEIPEVILWLAVNDNEYFGYEVLSFKDGSVYGYTLWYRSFMDLKEDGTFSFSGGAADNGIGTIKFDETGYTINNITYCESVIDSDNNMSVSYFVNHESATEEEFLSAIEEQGQKADAVWYDFTDDNISDIVR